MKNVLSDSWNQENNKKQSQMIKGTLVDPSQVFMRKWPTSNKGARGTIKEHSDK